MAALLIDNRPVEVFLVREAPAVLVGPQNKNEPRCYTPAAQAEFRLNKRLAQMGLALPGRQVSTSKGVQ